MSVYVVFNVVHSR